MSRRVTVILISLVSILAVFAVYLGFMVGVIKTSHKKQKQQPVLQH